MTNEESIKAVDWTLKTLGFGLYDDQKELWTIEASGYSKKQWFDAVKDYYLNRKSDFRPVLQDVVGRIKGDIEISEEKEHFKPDESLTYEQNYRNYLKWREK